MHACFDVHHEICSVSHAGAWQRQLHVTEETIIALTETNILLAKGFAQVSNYYFAQVSCLAVQFQFI